MKTVITAKKQTLTLESKPLGTGGSGEVYRITSPAIMSKLCVKLYHPKNITPTLIDKITYQVQNPPKDIMGLIEFILCWPTDIVYDQKGNFLGFVMPLAFPDSISLKMLSTAKVPNAAPEAIKQQFSRIDNVEGGLHRLNLCINLAHAVHKLHTAGYVVIDLKPENFMVTPNGSISVLDLDNVQVSDTDGNLLFNAELATIDYQPPEGLSGTLKPQSDHIPTSWDNFSLALMFYQILYGIHPYRASFKAPYEKIQSEHKAIEEGLYVHGSKSRFVLGKDSAHDKLLQTPDVLQMLFMRAFDVGHKHPERRPNAKEFGRVFFEIHNYFKNKWNNTTQPTRSSKTTVSNKQATTPPKPLPTHLANKLGHNQTLYNPPVSNHWNNTANTIQNTTQSNINQTLQSPNSTPSNNKNNAMDWKLAFWMLFAFLIIYIIATMKDSSDEYSSQQTTTPATETTTYNPQRYNHSPVTETTTHNYETNDYTTVRESPSETSSIETEHTDTSDRTYYAPNGSPYPDGAGYVEGYPKLNMEGKSIITILNDRNDFIIFGKLIDITNSYSPVEVRTFYIPPRGGLHLRDINEGRYELRLENVNEQKFVKTYPFSLKEDLNEGTKLILPLYNDGRSTLRFRQIDENEF